MDLAKLKMYQAFNKRLDRFRLRKGRRGGGGGRTLLEQDPQDFKDAGRRATKDQQNRGPYDTITSGQGSAPHCLAKLLANQEITHLRHFFSKILSIIFTIQFFSFSFQKH